MTSELRPWLLDVFCGDGGAGVGYQRAGFNVVGVDIVPRPACPFPVWVADALEVLAEVGRWGVYDAIHASPPCQQWTRAGKLRTAQGGTCSSSDLIAQTRALLRATGLPYILENVEGAPIQGVRLCGSSFGLKVRRHRIFESNLLLFGAPACDHQRQGRPIGVYHRMGDEIPRGGKTAANLEEASEAMGIDWMKWNELKEAIPPSFTEWIGTQLLTAIRERVA